MTRKSLAVLIVVNLVLLAALAISVFSPAPAQAQALGGGSQFMMIAGSSTEGRSQAVVYIVDIRTGRMIAITFNSNNNELELLGFRNISEDVNAGIGGGR